MGLMAREDKMIQMSNNSETLSAPSRIGLMGMKVISDRQVLWAVLGPSIGIALIDKSNRIGGLAHIMFSEKINANKNSHKFANVLIPKFIKLMVTKGACKENLQAKIVGGSKIPDTGTENPYANIGEDIEKDIRRILKKEDIPVVASDTGGEKGRKIKFYMPSGKIVIETIDSENREI